MISRVVFTACCHEESFFTKMSGKISTQKSFHWQGKLQFFSKDAHIGAFAA